MSYEFHIWETSLCLGHQGITGSYRSLGFLGFIDGMPWAPSHETPWQPPSQSSQLPSGVNPLSTNVVTAACCKRRFW